MRAIKKDPAFKKVMETKNSLKIRKDLIGWNRQNLISMSKKFLLNRLYEKQPIPQDQHWTYYECYRFFFLDLCIVAFQYCRVAR